MSQRPAAPSANAPADGAGFVRVRGAREHNLKNVDVDIPRDQLVVFTGVSGSGKSSLAFSTLYAEAQRRYFESVAPYARRLIDQVGVPDVDSIDGLPPAVALQQQRGTPSARSSVGSVTTLSSSIRMLYSRAGHYPDQQPMLYAEDFSPNTPQGACPQCHGLGRVHEVTEASMVPDPTLTIRERAVAAWPLAWQGQNLRDILVTLGYDVDTPWQDLPQEQRDWILFTEDTPTVPVYAGLTPAQTRAALQHEREPSYQGTFSGARRYLMHTFMNTQSALMRKRVAQYMRASPCPTCDGKRLKQAALTVTFAGLDIAQLSQMPLQHLAEALQKGAGDAAGLPVEKRLAAQRIVNELLERIVTLIDLGLGYLALERSTPTLSSGELQRLRLATQLNSQLFGVIYVLDEPSAGLHPADSEALFDALQRLKTAGNSLFVVEHDLDTLRRADWLIDVGPAAGEHGGQILYSGPPAGLEHVTASQTRAYLFNQQPPDTRPRRIASRWLRLEGVTRNNLNQLTAEFPLGCFTSVTGISGSGKSSLVSQALLDLVGAHLGRAVDDSDADALDLEDSPMTASSGRITAGLEHVKRLVQVDQKPIGRTPRSNLATYTGLFDHVRKLFASTEQARARGFDAGRFSFNVAKGRCEQCEGEGFVSVELLFMASVYAPCPACHGARYNPETLAVQWQGLTIAQVLQLTVDQALDVFAEQPAPRRALQVLQDIGLGYLRLGQPATELSGGEAQRIKLATELQRTARGATLYVLDEPTTGLHPQDVDRLLLQLNRLVDGGHTVVVVEHDMRVVAQSDWVIDIGPGAGDAGGAVVASGEPATVARCQHSRTAPFLSRALAAG